jgi:hypothetical protein
VDHSPEKDGAVERLGLKRTTLQNKMRRLGIKAWKVRSESRCYHYTVAETSRHKDGNRAQVAQFGILAANPSVPPHLSALTGLFAVNCWPRPRASVGFGTTALQIQNGNDSGFRYLQLGPSDSRTREAKQLCRTEEKFSQFPVEIPTDGASMWLQLHCDQDHSEM